MVARALLEQIKSKRIWSKGHVAERCLGSTDAMPLDVGGCRIVLTAIDDAGLNPVVIGAARL